VQAVVAVDLGLPLPPRFEIVVATTPAAYADGIALVTGLAAEQATLLAGRSVALAGPGRVIVNGAALATWCRRPQLALLAHELTHLAQRELTGPGYRGEPWLREGMAEWVAAAVLDRLGEESLTAGRRRALAALGLTERRGRRWPRYEIAFLIVDDLIRHRGFDALVAYFRAGTLRDTDRRFAQAFGVERRSHLEAAVMKLAAGAVVATRTAAEERDTEVPLRGAGLHCSPDAVD